MVIVVGMGRTETGIGIIGMGKTKTGGTGKTRIGTGIGIGKVEAGKMMENRIGTEGAVVEIRTRTVTRIKTGKAGGGERKGKEKAREKNMVTGKGT